MSFPWLHAFLRCPLVVPLPVVVRGDEQCSIKMALACAKHHSWQCRASVGIQTDETPALVDEYVAPAGAPCAATASPIPVTEYATLALAETCTERSPMIEYMTLGLAVSFSALALEIEYVPDDAYAAPASLTQHIALTTQDTYAAPALVIEHVSVAPVSQGNRDTRGLVNPQFSTARVDVILQEIPEVQVIERAREHIAFAGQIHQEHIVVPTPQFQEQFVESVQKTPRGRFPERIEEPIENTPIEDILPAVPASEYVAPAPVMEHVELAPPIENIAPASAAPNSLPNLSLPLATPRYWRPRLRQG